MSTPEATKPTEKEQAMAGVVTQWLESFKDVEFQSIGPVIGVGEVTVKTAAEGTLFALKEGFVYFHVEEPRLNSPYLSVLKEELRVMAPDFSQATLTVIALSVRSDTELRHLKQYGIYPLTQLFRAHMETPERVPYGSRFMKLNRIGPKDGIPLSLSGWKRFPSPKST